MTEKRWQRSTLRKVSIGGGRETRRAQLTLAGFVRARQNGRAGRERGALSY